MSEAPVPLPANPSANLDRRTASGERRIELPETALHATRVSEKFQIPAEAMRSTPPAPPSAPDGARAGAPATAEEGAPVHGETRRMPVPESIKRLALPTPPPFDPSSVAIPPATRLPSIATPAAIAPKETAVAGKDASIARTRARRELTSAIALFVVLLGVALLAMGLIALFLFA